MYDNVKTIKDLKNTKEGIRLYDYWNKMLDNFDDCNIEQYPENMGPVSNPPLRKFSLTIESTWNDSAAEYYRLASSLLYHGKFKPSKAHNVRTIKKIWSYHASGMELDEIATARLTSTKPMSRDSIYRIIKHVREKVLKPYMDKNLQADLEDF